MAPKVSEGYEIKGLVLLATFLGPKKVHGEKTELKCKWGDSFKSVSLTSLIWVIGTSDIRPPPMNRPFWLMLK